MRLGTTVDAPVSNFIPPQETFIQKIAFSPNGDFIISSTRDGDLRFWDIQTGNLIAETELDFRISNLSTESDFAISPDGRLIVLTGQDGLMRLWGIPRQKTGHEK